MRICVFGLSHLGTVAAACLAEAGFQITAIDPDPDVVEGLRQGNLPSFEPELANLLETAIGDGGLTLSSDTARSVPGKALVWVAFDTPVDEQDRADVEFVTSRVEAIFPHLDTDAVLLVSTQMPVGTIANMERRYRELFPTRKVSFACTPENLRLGKAVDGFRHPERLVIGVRDERAKDIIGELLEVFCDKLIWTRVESAEMAKHALNSFLATCITFINEVARLCEFTGADAGEVESALRSDSRIGSQAYLTAGAAFSGGTLARDVTFLNELAQKEELDLPLTGAILPSNESHRRWPVQQLKSHLGNPAGKKITVLGLSYKPGTDSIRRSFALEICRFLLEQGASVTAYDPMVVSLPADLGGRVALTSTAVAALQGAEALVVATQWPDFKKLTPDTIVKTMASALVVDPGKFLDPRFADDTQIQYYFIGKSA